MRNVGDFKNRSRRIDRFAGDNFAVDDDTVERRTNREQVGRGVRPQIGEQRIGHAKELNSLGDLIGRQAVELVNINRQAKVDERLRCAEQANLGLLQGSIGFTNLLAGNGASLTRV